MRCIALALVTVVWLVALSGCASAAPVIVNGSFEADGGDLKGVGYMSQGNPLSGWEPTTLYGVGRSTLGAPFFESGTVPDGRFVCVIQNPNAISQVVGGCEAGHVYELSVRANARTADAPNVGGMRVTFNGAVLVDVPRMEPVTGAAPYHAYTARFRAGDGSYELRIAQTSAHEGASILVDDVRLRDVTGAASDGTPVVEVNRST